MDPLSALMLRLSLCWLVLGVIVGGVMLNAQVLPADWRAAIAPTHGHMLFVGWLVQFALGVAYWLLPRQRTPERPRGYGERLAYAAVIALNIGLLMRVAGEPAQNMDWPGGWIAPTLTVSAILQVAAIVVFAIQLWPRVGIRIARTVRKPGERSS